MCAIAGILKFDPGARVETERLKRMARIQVHRGPDGEGMWSDGPVGLAHRRLAIVDVNGGAQPMSSADADTHLVCNGEIYNHAELRDALEARGHRYLTRSDSETILHAYEEHGHRCVERLSGMFAFALWDGGRKTLLLARDRLGIKPLYYTATEHELVFASEIKAILAVSAISPELNAEMLPEYLATRFVAGENTLFRHVRVLRPGQLLVWSQGHGLQLESYWSPLDFVTGDTSSGRRPNLAEQDLRERLTSVVRSHLMSDVPLGLFLSGGLDSTGLAALVAPMLREPPRTFSVGFEDSDSDERPWARMAANHVGAIHREISVSPSDFFAELPRLVWHEDEPIAFSSSIPLYFVSKMASEDVKVVLTGEGADELFLGYNRYRVTLWNERLSRWARVAPGEASMRHLRTLVGHLPQGVRRYLDRTFLARTALPRDLFCDNFAVFPERTQHELLRDTDLLRARDPYGQAMQGYGAVVGDSLARMSCADLQTYLVRLLMKQDRMSMAASIESRVPYLDHRLVEHVLALPSSNKLSGWRTKAILRDALSDLVPAPILRRRKMGFPVPVGRWLRGPFWPVVSEFVLGPRAASRKLFRPSALAQMAHEHRTGRADHGERLWLLINLEIWQRVFFDGEAVSDVARAA